MPVAIPINICFAIMFFSMFISSYHRREAYLAPLIGFMLNTLIVLYIFFIYFGLLK